MHFPIFFLLTWLTVSIFAVMRKKLSLVENTFVFLIILLVSINFSWIITDELKLITRTKEWLPYTAYLLNRSIIIPILILIHVNIFMTLKTSGRKAIVFLISVLLLVGISFLSNILNIIDYTEKWNLGMETIYFALLNIVATLSCIIMQKVSKNAVNHT